MINALRDAVGAIGEVRLGVKKEDVGTHSIRSGAAMAMYLEECPVFMIMLIGRWSSDAFLRYIRKQVMEFSQNVAKRMLSCQNFRHIPDIHMRVQQLETTLTIARRGEMLVATRIVVSGYLPSRSSVESSPIFFPSA